MTHLLHLLVFSSCFEYHGHVVGEAKLLESFGDVITCDGLLRLLLGDLVCFGRDEGDELDAALYKKVASFLGERDSILCGKNFRNDLLDSG